MLLLGWSHRYKNYTVIITIWFIFTKYTYLKWQWIFYFLRILFPFLYHCQDFDRNWLNIREAPEFTSGFLVGTLFLIFLGFCVVLLCVITLRVPCSAFRIQTMFGSSIHSVVCRRAYVLFTLFVFVCTWWCPPHIVLCLRVVFRRLVYSMLPVSLDCPFLITSSVSSNVYLPDNLIN
jgi:hypothetical protein